MSAAPIAVTPGEPAGVGPELLLALAAQPGLPAPPVAFADRALLAARARDLGVAVDLLPYTPEDPPRRHRPGTLWLVERPLAEPVVPGRPNPANAAGLLEALAEAVQGCLQGRFAALVTGPLHKAVIQDAGIPFSGHTEFIGRLCGGRPVMMLCRGRFRVALATTHLPLRAVPDAITAERLAAVLEVLDADLRRRFGCPAPRILVTGLNPHAGEGGHLGDEEQRVIAPVLERLRRAGLDLHGPVPADTAFLPERLRACDAVLAMYHDQGLPVIKHAGFGRVVNVTLGLPIVRTSVDHGTALDLAGTGRADPASLIAAFRLAARLARR